MKLSKKGEYALKALIELTINHERGITTTLINDISKHKRIPKKYLEYILLQLRNAGILISKRGVGGGYAFTRPPENITLGEIIRTIEGPLAPLNCVSKSAHVSCPEELSCGLHSVMLDVRNAISNVVDNISLKDIAKKTMELIEAKQNALTYVI